MLNHANETAACEIPDTQFGDLHLEGNFKIAVLTQTGDDAISHRVQSESLSPAAKSFSLELIFHPVDATCPLIFPVVCSEDFPNCFLRALVKSRSHI